MGLCIVVQKFDICKDFSHKLLDTNSILITKKIKYIETQTTKGATMLHEYREEISQLKQSNAHFAKIFEKHNELDQQAKDAGEGRLHLTDVELDAIKKEKLLIKDEALKMILDYQNTQA